MSVFHGKTAKVTIGGNTLEAITGWSMTPSADVAESTVMQESGFWQDFEAGFEDASASVEGNARTTRDVISQLGAEAELNLYIDSSHYFSFNAICTGFTETANKDDIGKISYSFEMDDATGISYS